MKYFVYLVIVSFACQIYLSNAQSQTCSDCNSILTDDENNQLKDCLQNCQTKYAIPNNLFSHSIFTQQTACADDCSNTDSIRKQKICKINNCGPPAQYQGGTLQSCKLQHCSQQQTDLNVFIGQQSEILAPSLCKNVSFKTDDDLKQVISTCVNAFYQNAEKSLNFSKTQQYLDLQKCMTTNCYKNPSQSTLR
ncbi:hypothetical protein TTHERM_00295990 (macronuclear) [Tetrahymena thermophila SB210]|uniref:Transmembrane protein n=1 Tax=Tetrahymena thermophila (strain SB210) TaxID=312017 RepID=I7MDZ1_TETTS|nr:hypothetical protein TTHERM_00295990 [Tetrahymena thermophila SB210]EAR92986.2 hypothetical protein TTHERM_00295990 [Tetrahymena thermophila SB210]|eukprot:XP_001013231.2 hypothetical protein TTHERM_00295990 [Tetrahymena thermophila SB210]